MKIERFDIQTDYVADIHFYVVVYYYFVTLVAVRQSCYLIMVALKYAR